MLFFSGIYISPRHLLYLEISRFLEEILTEHVNRTFISKLWLQVNSFTKNLYVLLEFYSDLIYCLFCTYEKGFIEANKVSISLNLSSVVYIIFTLCSLIVQAYYFTSENNKK